MLNQTLLKLNYIPIKTYRSLKFNCYKFSDGPSANKKFTSTFKIRSRLAQFFKHIHPDQMNQAPTKIKEENMRSLKNFNQYIDSINQQKSMQGKLLKFYIAQKTNHKSKKFYSFNLQLPDIQSSKMNEQKSQRLLQDIVTALNSKFKESQEGISSKKTKNKKLGILGQEQSGKSQIKFQTQQERIQREQQTIKPFDQYKNYKDKLVQQRLKNQINAKFVQSEKQNLEMKLRQNVSFADTASSKPMMWARISMEESGIYKNYQEILNSLIDPKLIYFDQKLNNKQIQEFKKKLLPGNLDPLTLRNNDYINDVCEEMESFHPPLCFFVSNHYSGSQIPGFFTIPYNFKPKELKQKFNQLKSEIQSQQQTFIQYYDYFKQLQKQLRQSNLIKINLKEFKGNSDISQKILMMKRLSRYSLPKPTDNYYQNPTFYPMTQEQFQITLKYYIIDQPNIDIKIRQQLYQSFLEKQKGKLKTVAQIKVNGKSKVFHLINFNDSDMEKVIYKIVQESEAYGKNQQQSKFSESTNENKQYQQQQNKPYQEQVNNKMSYL